MIQYFFYNKQQIYNIMTRKGDFVLKVISGHKKTHFKNFDYFSPSDLDVSIDESNLNFIVAVDSDIDRIVGVLKYKVLQEKVRIHKVEYFSILLIDVNREYRRKGIATRLYAELNKNLEKGSIVVNPNLSLLNKRIDLNLLARKQLTSAKKVYIWDEWMAKKF